jgi:hypothetical protein
MVECSFLSSYKLRNGASGSSLGETLRGVNTKEEINQTFTDYHKTQFGGWPWPKYDQVHDRSKGRFAKHADGREEHRG